jgi:hypothetical protein
VRLGHERGGALVARRDDADAGALERIEQAKERFARDGEGVADPRGAEGISDVAADGARTGLDGGLELGLRLGIGSGDRSGIGFGRRPGSAWDRARSWRLRSFGR